VTHFVSHYGLALVFLVVFLEVAGLPFVPGETALIAAGVLASRHHLSLAGTVAVGVGAAVVGACAGYAIGRWRGRELLSLWDWLDRLTHHAVRRSDEFFDRHGAKAVFLGRFLPVLRATVGWMAGVARMQIARFLLWNVVGGVVWGVGVSLAAYFLGGAVLDAIDRGLGYGAAALIVVVAVALVGMHVVRRRVERA
jgi:undecaprenyl-diphosphatase